MSKPEETKTEAPKKGKTVSFNKEEVEKNAQVEPEATDVKGENDAPEKSTALSISAQKEEVQGEINQSDLIMPSLRIAHLVGELGQTFTPGNLVYNGDTVISDGPNPIEITVLKLKKIYEEVVDYDEGVRGRTWDKIEDVKAEDLWIDWRDGEAPPVREAAYAMIAIKAPEGLKDHPLFPFEYNGEAYALSVYKMTGSAYNRAAKIFFTAQRSYLRNGLTKASFLLKTEKVKLGKHYVFVPVVKNGPKHDDAKAAFFASLLSS